MAEQLHAESSTIAHRSRQFHECYNITFEDLREEREPNFALKFNDDEASEEQETLEDLLVLNGAVVYRSESGEVDSESWELFGMTLSFLAPTPIL